MNRKSSIQVEWVNVTYRSVVVVTTTLVLGALVAGGSWFYFNRLAPREQAQEVIDNAAARLQEASRHRGNPRVDEILGGGETSLQQARTLFDERNYADAILAGISAENLAIRALSAVEGSEAEERQVRFYAVEGDVRVKAAGAFAWSRADSRTVLHVGDQVKTSSSASAKVIYFDGTVTTIQPGSLMEIRDLFEDPVTKVRRVREKLSWGEVQASTQERNVDGSFHEVATEKVTARSEQAGEFRVRFDREQHTSSVDVFDGRIEVATDSKKASVDAGERVTAQADGELSGKQTLPGVPGLIMPTDERVFIFEDPDRESISLSWQPVAGSQSYRLMISDKSLFTEPLYDARRGEVAAVIEGVPPGSYHWRVAAISAAGVEGPFSVARRFRVTSQHIRDRSDQEPPKLEISEFVPVGQMVIVNGKTEPGALLWIDEAKVNVYEDGNFNAVVRLRKEGLNELSIVAQDTAGNETRQRRSAFVELY